MSRDFEWELINILKAATKEIELIRKTLETRLPLDSEKKSV
jgi:hypothetical protein